MERVNVITAPFAVAYMEAPLPPPSRAANEEKLTIEPPAGIIGTTSRCVIGSELDEERIAALFGVNEK